MRAGRVSTVTLLLCLASPVAAQSSSSAFSHRPWVGVGFGWGVFAGPQLEGPGGLLAASLDVPLTPLAGVRVSADRIWQSIRDYGDVSLRQLSAELTMRRTISRTSACDMQSVVGLGLGVYRFLFESGAPEDPTRIGYQIGAGADCVGGRLAIGGLLGFRFIDAPDHPAFTSDVVIAGTGTFTVRIRF
jgi:hypothetical protein